MTGKQVELEIIEVWGTIDGEKVYPYVNIYDKEEEARKEIGTKQDGLEIVDVLKGWFITGTEGNIETISNDFYFSKEEAEDDLEERIIPAHKELGFEVIVKKEYSIPVIWQMIDTMKIKATSLEEAISKAKEAELPKGEYLSDSFEVQRDFIEDDE